MTNSLAGQLAAVSNPESSAIQLIKQAVKDLIKSENIRFRTPEEDLQNDNATDRLLAAIRQLRVVTIVPLIKPWVDETKNDALLTAVQETLEDRTDLPTSTLEQKIVDYLALANLRTSEQEIIIETDEDEDDLYKKREPAPLTGKELNGLAHFFLGRGQGYNIQPILLALEEVQAYYPRANTSSDDFALSLTQAEQIDDIIIATTNKYLQDTRKDVETTERFVNLLINLEDTIASTDLTRDLFDHRMASSKIEYIEGLVDDARKYEADDAEVKNPILARFGKTYGEVYAAIDNAGGKVSQLLGYTPRTEPSQQTLDL